VTLPYDRKQVEELKKEKEKNEKEDYLVRHCSCIAGLYGISFMCTDNHYVQNYIYNN